MKKSRVLVWRECNWYVAQCLEVDVASQGGSQEEALDNISEALRLQFEQPASSIDPPPIHLLPKDAAEIEIAF